MPYHVFASYAQADREKNLDNFIEQFREELRGLMAIADDVDKASIVFFDRESVKAGDKWNEKITEAVSNADVLVCLVSPTYLGRPWCGRELEIFARRNKNLAAGVPARFVFPIWWQTPVAPRPLPPRLGQFNYRDPQFPPKYDDLGVRGLARSSLWAQFKKMADRLAKLVAETLAAPYRLPPGEPVADILEIANAFDEQQPYDVRYLSLTVGGDAWQPSATDLTVESAAEQAARRLQVFIRSVDLGAGLVGGLQKAQADQQVLLVVVDAATPPDVNILTINDLDLPNLAVLLADVGTPSVGADKWIEEIPAGSFSKSHAAGLLRVATAGDLQAEMQRLIDEARRRLRIAEPVARAVDPALEALARKEGITTGIQPNLAGPGAAMQP